MNKKYYFLVLLIFGFLFSSDQQARAQSGLQFLLISDLFDEVVGTPASNGINIEITEDNILQIAPENSLKTTYFEDKDGDGFTSGNTKIDIPGLEIPGYKEIMFLDRRGISEDYLGNFYFVFDCDDNDKNVIRATLFVEDQDGDGYYRNSPAVIACTRPEGYISTEDAKGPDCDDDFFDQAEPGIIYYRDRDGDGYAVSGSKYCADPDFGDFNFFKTANELISVDIIDCDDANRFVWNTFEYYIDEDEDGYGSTAVPFKVCYGDTKPIIANAISTSLGEDCDDTDPDVTVICCEAIASDGFANELLIPGCSISDLLLGTGLAFNDGDLINLTNEEFFCTRRFHKRIKL
jgi:hypothetical protein